MIEALGDDHGEAPEGARFDRRVERTHGRLETTLGDRRDGEAALVTLPDDLVGIGDA